MRSSSSSTLKRTRPSNSGLTPHIPPIQSEKIVLQIFTHRSLTHGNASKVSDNLRLSVLGEQALQAAVTCLLHARRPILSFSDIIQQRIEILSDANISQWVTMYGLRMKMRCMPDAYSKLTTPEETRSLFYAYVGGLFYEGGLSPIEEWLSHLIRVDEIDCDSQPPNSPPPQYARPSTPPPPPKRIKSEAPNTSDDIFYAFQPPPSPAPFQFSARIPPANPLAPAQPDAAFLPLFNQLAMQKRVSVEYPADFSGPAHAGRWTVQCIVGGILKGSGMGSSKQVAREEAARKAYYAMGWT